MNRGADTRAKQAKQANPNPHAKGSWTSMPWADDSVGLCLMAAGLESEWGMGLGLAHGEET